MRSRYKITEEDGLYFISSTIVEWIPVFTSVNYFEILIDSMKHCQKNKNLKIYAFVILENHFHMIVVSERLLRTIQSLKRHTAQEIIMAVENQEKKWLLNQLAFYKKRHKIHSAHQIWQEGFHPELILNDKMLIQKFDYIHQNPVKKGYVDKPEHWRYSSARNFILDDHSVIELDF